MSAIVKTAVKEFPTEKYLEAEKYRKGYSVLRDFESYLYNKHKISNCLRTERPSTRLERLYYWLNAKIMHPKGIYFGHSYTDTNRPTKVTLYFDKEIPISEKDFWSQVDEEDHLLPVINVFWDESRFIPESVIKNLRAYIESKGGKIKQERICHEAFPHKIYGNRKVGEVREIFEFKLPERKNSRLSLTAFSIDRPEISGESKVKVRYYIETPTNVDDTELMETLDYLVKTVDELYSSNSSSG